MFIILLFFATVIIDTFTLLLHPGLHMLPIWLTILIGIGASLIAGLLIGGLLGFILAVVIAAVLVGVVGNARRGSRTV